MSNASKGAAIEREAVRVLEARGYLVHRTIRTPVLRGGLIRGSHSNDVFNAFDIVAMQKREYPHKGSLLMVQVTTKEMMRARERKVLEAVGAHVPVDRVDVEVWGFVGGSRKNGGQRFRRTQWNGLEWAALPELELLAKPKKGKKHGTGTNQSTEHAGRAA